MNLFDVRPEHLYKVHVRSADVAVSPSTNSSKITINLPAQMYNNDKHKRMYVVLDFFKLLSPNSINDGVFLRSSMASNQGYSSFNGTPNILYYIPPADNGNSTASGKAFQYVNQSFTNGIVVPHINQFDLFLTDKNGNAISAANLANGWECQLIVVYLHN